MPATRVAEVQSVESPEAQVQGVAEVQPQPAPAPVEVVSPTVNAKIKGGSAESPWKFVYGTYRQSFVDGHRYDLPRDVFEYLKSRGCIYDTL